MRGLGTIVRPLGRALASGALLGGLALAASAAPGDGRTVPEALRQRVAREGRVPVVVELDEPALPEAWLPSARSVRDQRRRIVARQIDAIYDLGGTDAGPALPYPVVPFMAMEVGPRALAVLEAAPWVRDVRAARVLEPSLDVSVPAVQGDAVQALGFDGTGQVVAVLDTGVDGGHQNFPPGKIVDEACFASGANNAGNPQGGGGDCPGGGDTAFGPGSAAPCDYDDGCFHGTHVAGIAVGAGDTYPGVAPGAGLVPIQIFSEFPGSLCPDGQPCPRAWDFDQDAALLHVYQDVRLDHDVAAVNLSLGSGAFTEPCDAFASSTRAAIDNLRSVGIATVIAAGNNSCTDEQGNPTGCTDALSIPACISSAVSVSAVKDNGGIPGFANRAPFLSLYAPGHTIRAPGFFTVSGYLVASGTSMAAPHVAGAWALVRQAVPGASVTEALVAFQDSGEPRPHAPILRARDALGLLGYPACDDGIDDDGDGLADLEDPGCSDAADLSEQAPGLVCDNGLDDDGDGAVDTADPGCRDPGWIAEDPACDDGIDNDGDGGTDFAGASPDPECQAAWWPSEVPASSCGLGPSLAIALPLWAILRRHRPRRGIPGRAPARA